MVCCPGVSPLQKHEVDQPAMLVDCSEQVFPPAADLDVGLVQSPGSRTVALIRSHSFLKLGRIAMNPAHDRGRVHFHTKLLHRHRQVPVRDSVLAVPTNTKQDDLDRETTTLEQS